MEGGVEGGGGGGFGTHPQAAGNRMNRNRSRVCTGNRNESTRTVALLSLGLVGTRSLRFFRPRLFSRLEVDMTRVTPGLVNFRGANLGVGFVRV